MHQDDKHLGVVAADAVCSTGGCRWALGWGQPGAGCYRKTTFPVFQSPPPTLVPGTAHPSPLPCPPPHLTGFRLDRTLHTGTSQCLNKSQLKPRLKLSKVSSISSHALKNQESLRSCSEALPTDAVRSVAQLLSIYKENVLKYPLTHWISPGKYKRTTVVWE